MWLNVKLCHDLLDAYTLNIYKPFLSTLSKSFLPLEYYNWVVSEHRYMEKTRGEVTAACMHVLPAFLVLIQMLFLVHVAYLKNV